MWLLSMLERKKANQTDPSMHLQQTNRSNIKSGDLLFVIDAHNLKNDHARRLYHI